MSLQVRSGIFLWTHFFDNLETLSYQRIVDQGYILCDEGFPAENQPLGVEKGKPTKEGEQNCEPEPEEEMSTNQKKIKTNQYRVKMGRDLNQSCMSDPPGIVGLFFLFFHLCLKLLFWNVTQH